MTPREHERVAEAFALVQSGASDGVAVMDTLPETLRGALADLLRADERNSDGFLDRPAMGQGFHAPSAAHAGTGDAPHTPPAAIGPYRVIATLNEGELCSVYLCEQEEPVRRRAAVKLLRSRSATSEVRRRFDLERGSISLMDHPNVARLYDAGTTTDGKAWFAMEYVAGEAITAAARRERLPVRARLDLFIRACRGLEHAHQRGIIHRDIKPSNVLAAKAPDGFAVKVIDFGLAKAMRSLPGATSLGGRILGTISYMSPEQLKGDSRRIDTRADVYGLGALLYELIADRPAFGDAYADPPSVIRAIMHEPPAPLPPLPRALAGDLRAIVERALDKDRDHRYPSVAELRADIERMLAGLPVAARRRRPVYLARKFVRRNRVWICAAALAIAGIAWGATTAWDAREHRHRLGMDMARAWFEQTLGMARSINERAQRRPLLVRLDEQSEMLARLSPSDPGVLDMRAGLLKARGDLELEEGWTRRAHELFLRSLEIRRVLAAAAPGDPVALADLSIAMVRVGDAVNDDGRRDEALKWYMAALAADEDAARRFPADARTLTTLVWSMDRIAAFAPDEASRRALHVRQMEAAVRLHSVADGVDERRAMAVAHTHLAGHATRVQQLEEAMDHAALAIEYAEAAAALAPENRFARHTLVGALMARSQVLAAAGDRGGALADAAQAVAAAQRVADADPNEVNSAWQLACVLGQAAQRAESAGDSRAALAFARRFSQQAGHVASLQPTNPQARLTHSNALAALARLEDATAR